jgi:hypothetical protein
MTRSVTPMDVLMTPPVRERGVCSWTSFPPSRGREADPRRRSPARLRVVGPPLVENHPLRGREQDRKPLLPACHINGLLNRTRGWVAPGCCLAGAPTDPDVPDSGIRLFETQIRYVGRERLGVSSG